MISSYLNHQPTTNSNLLRLRTQTLGASALAELVKRGWDVIPSESNFVFAKPPAGNKAEDVFKALKKDGIFVRYFNGPKTKDRLRITIGTDSQMKKLIHATEKLILR